MERKDRQRHRATLTGSMRPQHAVQHYILHCVIECACIYDVNEYRLPLSCLAHHALFVTMNPS